MLQLPILHYPHTIKLLQILNMNVKKAFVISLVLCLFVAKFLIYNHFRCGLLSQQKEGTGTNASEKLQQAFPVPVAWCHAKNGNENEKININSEQEDKKKVLNIHFVPHTHGMYIHRFILHSTVYRLLIIIYTCALP